MEVLFRDPSVPLTDDQLTLRRQVYKEISSNPETFDMTAWEAYCSEDGFFLTKAEAAETSCRTTRCIAGWAAYYAGIPVAPLAANDTMAARGITLLGLTRDEYAPVPGRNNLFHDTDVSALARMRVLAGEE